MTKLVISPQARRDINVIWDQSVGRWGAERTERYLRDLWRTLEMAAEDPRRGQSCNEIRAGYFKIKVTSHVAFYRLTPGGIDVVRILHGRMDFDKHM